jgi:hypothetical protein
VAVDGDNPRVIIRYTHHDVPVFVDAALKGKHREHCLCFKCEKFHPGDERMNCPMAQATFENCKRFALVTPVYECPAFRPQEPA